MQTLLNVWRKFIYFFEPQKRTKWHVNYLLYLRQNPFSSRFDSLGGEGGSEKVLTSLSLNDKKIYV